MSPNQKGLPVEVGLGCGRRPRRPKQYKIMSCGGLSAFRGSLEYKLFWMGIQRLPPPGREFPTLNKMCC